MDRSSLRLFVDRTWDASIIPTLSDYIRIPNKSPAYDDAWQSHGYMEQAIHLIEAWCHGQKSAGTTVEVIRLSGRTPLLYIEVPAKESDQTVLLYGHYDKQPEMVGWWDGFGPWTPVVKNDRLYGRGGADDGYATFASLTAIRALQDQGLPHPRCVVLIEGCEESGSFDLPFYIEFLADRIGSPRLIVCLDSGCGDYERLWGTTSLRGNVVGTLRVDILREGVHSGSASGVVASSFRIARQLLSRLEDEQTGRILLESLHAEIPIERVEQARIAASILGGTIHSEFPFVAGAGPVGGDLTELLLNKTWRPTLSITGADGLPASKDGGNVLRPGTALKLSFRTPPSVDADAAYLAIKRVLESEPPYGAQVSFEGDGGSGWSAPPLAPWLAAAAGQASLAHFGQEMAFTGEGGSIPFMGMLGRRFPAAQFLITGVLGPQSNAHGPNEYLHIPAGKRLTACVAEVLLGAI
ncbi:MAG: M20 family metallopeptidase [Candidatus Eisenbacteria bacterium]|nr:M20 family metallopeptidase [Candidatus Eisenbacteria bacterium]